MTQKLVRLMMLFAFGLFTASEVFAAAGVVQRTTTSTTRIVRTKAGTVLIMDRHTFRFRRIETSGWFHSTFPEGTFRRITFRENAKPVFDYLWQVSQSEPDKKVISTAWTEHILEGFDVVCKRFKPGGASPKEIQYIGSPGFSYVCTTLQRKDGTLEAEPQMAPRARISVSNHAPADGGN